MLRESKKIYENFPSSDGLVCLILYIVNTFVCFFSSLTALIVSYYTFSIKIINSNFFGIWRYKK